MVWKRLQSNYKKVIMGLFALIALMILMDYTYTSNQAIENVISKNRVLENKYSVARNYYYAYYVHTDSYHIPVSKSFRDSIQIGNDVAIDLSLLFNEINNITIPSSNASEIYSFRMATGLFLPSFVLLIMGIGWKLGHKTFLLVFVCQVVLLADILFLLFN